MKTILRAMVATVALGAALTTRPAMTGHAACATSDYPVDFAALLEYSGSQEIEGQITRVAKSSSPVADRSP